VQQVPRTGACGTLARPGSCGDRNRVILKSQGVKSSTRATTSGRGSPPSAPGEIRRLSIKRWMARHALIFQSGPKSPRVAPGAASGRARERWSGSGQGRAHHGFG
jgi:hypothetical protein